MLTGELRSQIDSIWNALWSGGISKPMERRIFPEGQDAKGRDFNDLRWSRFKNFAPEEMFSVVDRARFPFPAHHGRR